MSHSILVFYGSYRSDRMGIRLADFIVGRLAGTRSATIWHSILSEMGMVPISSQLAIGPISEALDAKGEPIGPGAAGLERAFTRFADDLAWWTAAAQAQRARRKPPY